MTATENPATYDELATIKNGQHMLGEVCEELQDIAERSNEWLETVMLAVGFFLLAVAAKAPEELEVLGAKLSIQGNFKALFLAVLAVALVLRLIRGWAMATLSSHAINAKFDEVTEVLSHLNGRLAEHLKDHHRAAKLAIDRAWEGAQLDSVNRLFDVSGLLDGGTLGGSFNVFSMTPAELRLEAEQSFQQQRQRLLDRGLADWYPEALWQQASDAALNLAVAEREASVAMRGERAVVQALGGQASPADVAEEEEAAKLVKELRTRRNDALSALSLHVEAHTNQAKLSLDTKGDALERLASQVDKIIRRAKLYWYIAKASLVVSLLLPSLAALAATAAILHHYAA